MQDNTGSTAGRSLFISELRQRTSESHQQLEENNLSRTLLSPDITMAGYQAYLVKMYGITQACESQVFPALLTVFPDLPDRHRALQIRNDLVATGMSESDVDKISIAAYDFDNAAEAAGILYVLEGSTLGGRVIYKHVNQHLGLTSETGASYFSGYGQQTGSMWKTFISRLDSFAEVSGEGNAIIDSAIKTFTYIDGWLGEAVAVSEK